MKPRAAIPPGQARRRRRAFTIIEVMVAIVLLTLAATVFVQTIEYASQPLAISDRREAGLEQAAVLALAEYRESGLRQGAIGEHPQYGSVRWSIRADPIRDGLERVEIALDPDENGEPMETTTYLYQPGGRESGR
ncbi:MAG: type II secretion system protein [Puniceicoccaceae bacterium]